MYVVMLEQHFILGLTSRHTSKLHLVYSADCQSNLGIHLDLLDEESGSVLMEKLIFSLILVARSYSNT